MGIQERIDALQPRERRLLVTFVGLFVVVALLLIPIAVSATLAETRGRNEQLRQAIDRMFAERDDIQQLREDNEKILSRYKTPAPALAGFLDKNAKALSLEIPQFKDRPIVPHGKQYEEHSTEIQIKKVGMGDLVRFMEKIAQAQFPVSITRLIIRKRGTQEDSWDATLVVSAYHRKAAPEKPKKEAAPAAGDTAEDESGDEEEEAE